MAASMKLQSIEYRFVILTPAMIGGATGRDGSAEMRVASIRGQVRWWHRSAGLTPQCNEVWGQVEPVVIASKVSLSLAASPPLTLMNAPILPHKQSASRNSIAPGQTFSVILRRHVGCDLKQWRAAQHAVKLWLLLGGLGLRVNRAAGSIWPTDDHLLEPEKWVPRDEKELRSTLTELGYSKIVRLIGSEILEHGSLAGENTEGLKLRKAASDTVNGSPKYFGSIQPRRTPSPLKMKVIRLGTDTRLILTGLATEQDFEAARNALGAGKPLGSVAWG